MASKVSFTIRRPTPVSRAASSGPDSDAGSSFRVPQLPSRLSSNRVDSPLTRSGSPSPTPPAYVDNDSSDAESVVEDELVTGFDSFGVQRLHGRKKVDKPLVIPALKNKDWRELARKRRSAAQFVPPSAAAQTGQDGSVGGLGTKDVINSGPVLSGLQVKEKKIVENDTVLAATEHVKMDLAEEETEEQRALRAILAETSDSQEQEGPIVDIIPTPISEAEALRQDVAELPDVSTLEDYNRVPVSQFGAAMLRGMGWKEGTAATRKAGRGLVEPYLPAARPALLGIGAKEQEVYDDGSKKTRKSTRPERRYVPIIKQERSDSANGSRRERSRSPRRSGASSRRNSPDRYASHWTNSGDPERKYYDEVDPGQYKDSGKRFREERRRLRDDDEGTRPSSREQERDSQRWGDRRRDSQRSLDEKRDRSRETARRRKDY